MKSIGHSLPHERYTWQWLAVGGVIAALVVWALASSRVPSWPSPHGPKPTANGVDWFLILQMPEVPSDPAQAQAAKERFFDWLKGLAEAGFQPMKLSAALSWLDQGRPLPKKSVVLLFYPGYRQTYDELAPILAKTAFPAVWLLDREAVRRADHRYLSRRGVEVLRTSALWDVGWFGQPPARSELVSIELEAEGKPQPSRFFKVNPRIGNLALNRGAHLPALHQLYVSPTWTTQELVDRLLVEAPIENPSYLTARQIGSQAWGAAVEANASARPQPFDLQTAPDERSVSVTWPSTQSHSDFQLQLEANPKMGELWVFLRSDRSLARNLRVGLVDNQLIVEEEQRGHSQRLAVIPRNGPADAPLSANMLLVGQRFELSADKQPAVLLQVNSPGPANRQDVVEFMLSDKVRGAAQANAISLLFTPVTNR